MGKTRTLIHLTASPFLGGPEHQMLGLGRFIGPGYRSVYASFSERGHCRPLLERARALGFTGIELRANVPQLRASVQEITRLLRQERADILCCHGYKADVLGWLAARRTGTPIISVSHGWTRATLKVKVYEALDKASLRLMDAVVCVSAGQAAKARRAGVPASLLHVIRNAVDLSRFEQTDSSYRDRMLALFSRPPRYLVGAAGRFSPEKGFAVLVEAAAQVSKEKAEVGFVLFGDGPLRDSLTAQIAALGLQEKIVLAGFRPDLDRWLPSLDLLALSSYTEGLPSVVLEAFAARVPVAATAVGGTPEVIEEGRSGYLVPPGEPSMLARRILDVLADESRRQQMGECGYQRIQREFTFAVQAEQYRQLFDRVLRTRCGVKTQKQTCRRGDTGVHEEKQSNVTRGTAGNREGISFAS